MNVEDDETPQSLPTIDPRTRLAVTSVVVLVALTAAAVGTGLVVKYLREREAAAPRAESTPLEVQTVVVELSERAIRSEATGFLRAPVTLRLSSEVAGRLVAKLKEEGETVEENEVVARIDDRSFRERLGGAHARRASTLARLEYTRKMRDRAEKLAREDSIGESELDEWTSQVRALEASLADHDSAIAEAELQVERSQVTAPRAGVWYEDLAQPGEYVQPGTPIGTLRVLKPLELRVETSAQVRLALERGQQVDVELLDVDPSLHAVGSFVAGASIRDLPAGVDERSRRFPVVIEVPNDDLKLLPGLFARVRFELERRESLLLVPKECVFESYGQPSVYVVRAAGDDGNRSVEIRDVNLRELEDLPAFWQVVEGLSEGERVVVSPIEQLSRGARVRLEDEVDARTD